MKRTDFIKLLGLGAASTILPSFSLSSNKKGKVIVVGGGMAGVTAANELTKTGWEVQLLEARNRLGGRIHSNRDWGFPIEMGANWIHQTEHPENPLAALTKKAGVDLKKTDFDSFYLFDKYGKRIKSFQLLMGLLKLKDTERYIKSNPNLSNHSVQDIYNKIYQHQKLNNTKKACLQTMFLEQYRMLTGEELDKVNGEYYGKYLIPQAQSDYVVLGGYDQLIDHQVNGFSTELECEVTEIEHQKNRVKVISNKGIHEADYVVVTVPLGVLKSGKIKFTSGLSDTKKGAIQNLGFGIVNKVFLKFANKFWDKDKSFYAFQQATAKTYGIFFNQHPIHQQPIWTAFPSGDDGKALSYTNEEAIRQKWISIFHKSFPNKEIEIEAVKFAKWHEEEFSKGSYTYVGMKATGRSFDALAASEGRIHFAGEATNEPFHGNVHAAQISGIRAARVINGY